MTPPVWFVAALAAGTMIIKAAGPVALGGRRLPRRLVDMMGLAGPVLLAALAAVLTFSDGTDLVLDARLGGLIVAGAGLLMRLPLLVIVVIAAAATGLLRVSGWGT